MGLNNKVLFEDKERYEESPLPEVNKVTAENLTELKNVINDNADEAVEDVPSDGILYARIDGQWVPVSITGVVGSSGEIGFSSADGSQFTFSDLFYFDSSTNTLYSPSFNGVALQNQGSASSFLAADGNYSSRALLNWLFPYISGTHPKGTMTRIGTVLAISNQETNEYPVPVSNDDLGYRVPESPSWSTQSPTGDIMLCLDYQATNFARIRGIRTSFRNPSTYNYTIQLWDLSVEAFPVLLTSEYYVSPSVATWFEHFKQGYNIVPGEHYRIVMIVHNSANDTSVSSQWRKVSSSNAASGQIVLSDDQLIIHGFDESSTDRNSFLNTVDEGSVLTIKESSDPERIIQYRVTGPSVLTSGVYTIPVTVSLEEGDPLRSGQILDITIDVQGAVATTSYDELIGGITTYFPTGEIKGAITSNYADITDSLLTLDDNIYGIDLELETFSQSNHWDVIPIDSGSGEEFTTPPQEASSEYDSSLPDSSSMQQTIGGYASGTTMAQLRGKSFTEMWDDLLFPTVEASIQTNKGASLSGVSGITVEVGTSISPTLTASFNPGVIRNGNGSTGPNLVGDALQYTFNYPDGSNNVIGASGNSQSDSAPSHNISFGSNSWNVVISHDSGSGAYTDSKGNNSSVLDLNRSSGTVSANSSTITGRYYAWWYVGLQNTSPTNSSGVRGLSDRTFLNGVNNGSFSISIPSGSQEVSFFVPEGKNVSVAFAESSNADVTATFVKTTFTVNDAAGNIVSYDSYVSYLGATGFPSTSTYNVTIN